jgi:hypothetical protein
MEQLEASSRGSSLTRLPSIGTTLGEDEPIREDRAHFHNIEQRVREAMGDVHAADCYGRRRQNGRRRRPRLPWTDTELNYLIREVNKNGPAWQLIWDLNQEGTPVIHPQRTPVDYKDKAMVYKKDMIVYVYPPYIQGKS